MAADHESPPLECQLSLAKKHISGSLAALSPGALQPFGTNPPPVIHTMSTDPKASIAQMEKIVSLCKRRGFIFQSSEIYGGCGGIWDYGPLGAELKRNLRTAWWNTMTREREDVLGLDACILMNPAIWKASGHVETFADLMRECLVTNKRFRSDHIQPQSGTVYEFSGAIDTGLVLGLMLRLEASKEWLKNQNAKPSGSSVKFYESEEEIWRFWEAAILFLQQQPEAVEAVKPHTVDRLLTHFKDEVPHKARDLAFSVLVPDGGKESSAQKIADQFYVSRGLTNPALVLRKKYRVENSTSFNPENGAQLTEPRPFNLMLKTYLGPTATEADVTYLRPETAQAIFAQFKNVFDSSRVKVPFGIGQIGKAFRNEVTPKNFTFRSREFEQMELEFFIKPDEAVEIISGEVAK
jgi:dimeric type glycyl-tRNA synthetase